MSVLVVNSGSSSLKFQIISPDLERIKEHKDERPCRGGVEGIGGAAIVRFGRRDAASQVFTASLQETAATLDYVVRCMASDRSGLTEIKSTADVNAVGHRVVHGGEQFRQSALVDDKVLKGIEAGHEGKSCTEDSKVLAYAIPTDEEVLMARDTVRVILGEPHPS